MHGSLCCRMQILDTDSMYILTIGYLIDLTGTVLSNWACIALADVIVCCGQCQFDSCTWMVTSARVDGAVSAVGRRRVAARRWWWWWWHRWHIFTTNHSLLWPIPCCCCCCCHLVKSKEALSASNWNSPISHFTYCLLLLLLLLLLAGKGFNRPSARGGSPAAAIADTYSQQTIICCGQRLQHFDSCLWTYILNMRHVRT